MKVFKKAKDGGELSNATGYWLIEIKSLFSIVLLRFDGKSRENFHSHAFDALTWFLCGEAIEIKANGTERKYKRSLIPKWTPKEALHKVDSNGTSWAVSIRGPWEKTWLEYNKKQNKYIELTHGRKIVNEY